ncbi:MAG TPA: FtsH protease activity modulator HflK [Candidatus Binatia bacterium]|nr:FtsH protease activity modulator HflK [Candidatus Binatia bacterium]
MPDRYEWPPRRPNQQDPLADLRDLWTRIRSSFPGGGSGGGSGTGASVPSSGGFSINPYLILVVGILVWLASGVYIVAPDERGIVLRFGKVVRETDSGPHYRLPWPFETVVRPSVTAIRKEEIGYRTVTQGPPAQYQDVPVEALMLTGDENIVSLEFIVQYKVRADASGPTDFLFNVRNPQDAVRASAEAAMREVIGRSNIDQALTEGKEQIQEDTQKVLQQILDRYGVGLDIETVKLQDVDPPDQVSDAFKDVISSQQDKERLINESVGYANDVVPRARGEAAQLVNEAEGYREAKVRDATGVAQRFVALQTEYEKAKDVTRQRLYLETMEAILPGMNKIILDDLSAKQTVPYLPLEPLLRKPVDIPVDAPAGRR